MSKKVRVFPKRTLSTQFTWLVIRITVDNREGKQKTHIFPSKETASKPFTLHATNWCFFQRASQEGGESLRSSGDWESTNRQSRALLCLCREVGSEPDALEDRFASPQPVSLINQSCREYKYADGTGLCKIVWEYILAFCMHSRMP